MNFKKALNELKAIENKNTVEAYHEASDILQKYELFDIYEAIEDNTDIRNAESVEDDENEEELMLNVSEPSDYYGTDGETIYDITDEFERYVIEAIDKIEEEFED